MRPSTSRQPTSEAGLARVEQPEHKGSSDAPCFERERDQWPANPAA
jgi:hypothetical protein